MQDLSALSHEISKARAEFSREIDGLSPVQSSFCPGEGEWSILNIAEHIVWAEYAGLHGMWKAVMGLRSGKAIWQGAPVHRGLSIADIVARTWQPKEKVPDIAKPRWGGSLRYWQSQLEANQSVVDKLVKDVGDLDPQQIIYPHPISGPLDLIQRLQFLAFHMDRHRNQIKRVKADIHYPG